MCVCVGRWIEVDEVVSSGGGGVCVCILFFSHHIYI